VENTWFRKYTGTCLKDVSDVLRAKGVKCNAVSDGAEYGFVVVDLREIYDLLYMMLSVQTLGVKLLIVFIGTRMKGKKSREE
jgi:hypothetical protein